MLNKNEIKEEVIIEYNKRFANGEQYLQINLRGEIEEVERWYFWQERGVYNHIKPIVDRYEKELTEQDIYGKNGLVDLLIPYQQAYNTIKNRELEYINRVSMGVLCVEDGSVDTDNLEEEGLSPSKVIVYRAGRKTPELLTNALNTESYIASENNCLKQMTKLALEFVEVHKQPKDSKK